MSESTIPYTRSFKPPIAQSRIILRFISLPPPAVPQHSVHRVAEEKRKESLFFLVACICRPSCGFLSRKLDPPKFLYVTLLDTCDSPAQPRDLDSRQTGRRISLSDIDQSPSLFTAKRPLRITVAGRALQIPCPGDEVQSICNEPLAPSPGERSTATKLNTA